MTANFVSSRVPLVDPRTGLISREWYLLFQSLFGIQGDDSGTVEELVLLAPPPADTVDAASLGLDMGQLAPPPAPLFVALDDVLPVIGALRDEIAALRAQIDALRQGGIVL